MLYTTRSDIIKSTCGLCPVGCGILAHRHGQKITKIQGDPDSPLSRGALCPKGVASLEYLYHPERLKQPLKRDGSRGSGKWREISWDEALETIAVRLQGVKDSFGAESVVFAHGAAKGLQDSYLARFANVFGSPNVAWQGHVCFVPRVLASRITYGFYAVPDYDYPPSCIVVWGKNPESTLPHASERLAMAVGKGTELIVVDPVRTRLAQEADLWLQPRPGSDLALALGLLNVIISEELFDKTFVEEWTVGFNRLKKHISDYTPERVEELTRVPREKMKEAARRYARSRPACIQWGNAIDHGVNSFQTGRAICLLRAVTGNLGIPGGEAQPVKIPLHGRRSRELELWDEIPPDQWEKRLGSQLKVLPDIRYILPQSVIQAIINEEPYPVRALYIQGANPLLSYSNAGRAYEALMKVDFLVVADMFMTPTALLADVVLPVASYLEFDSIVTPPYSYPVMSVQQKITRVAHCRSDYEILSGLAGRLGLGQYFWDREEQCLDAVLKPAGLSFEEFRKIAIIPGSIQYRGYETSGFGTPSRKVELYSERLEKWGFEPLPAYKDLHETPYGGQERPGGFPLTLTTWKSALFRHSGGRQIASLRGMHPEPVVFIHPKTAHEAGIREGDRVHISTSRGMIVQKAHLTTDVAPSVIGVDYAWWFPENGDLELHGWAESNVNVLTSDAPPYNKEMGTTNLRGLCCKVSNDSRSLE